jgi:hypothetical protein
MWGKNGVPGTKTLLRNNNLQPGATGVASDRISSRAGEFARGIIRGNERRGSGDSPNQEGC